MTPRENLARIALRTALETRTKAQKNWTDPICIYDVVESLGTEVWFVGGSSFSGMYARGYDRLFIPSERPIGRKAFTCAHEFAHLLFGHGSRVEELDFDRSDHDVPEEVLANIFAAYLLMPRQAVFETFERLGCEPKAASPTDVYAAASQLCVGYETLIKHMRWSLKMISHPRMLELLSISPKEVKASLLGNTSSLHLVLVTQSWHKIAIDLEVGDFAILPKNSHLNGCSSKICGECAQGTIVEAVRPGLTQAIETNGPWSAMIRVSRRQFTGRGAYRHLEDPDEN